MPTYNREYLDQHVVLRVITGSTAQGTAIAGSDIDVKACVRLPNKDLFQLGDPWETESFQAPDVEYHALAKTFALLAKQNPSALEIINVEEQFVMEETQIGHALRANRHLFVSKKAHKAYFGYAKDQLMRIKNALNKASDDDVCAHIKFTIEGMGDHFLHKYAGYVPGGIAPLDVVMDEESGIPIIKLDAHLNGIEIQQLHGMVSEIYATYKNYKNLGWRNTKASPEKLWKHASHLVRLLLTCRKLLQTGIIFVRLEEEVELLLRIKLGQIPWDELFLMVDQLSEELKSELEKSPLPDDVDYEAINRLYTDLMMG